MSALTHTPAIITLSAAATADQLEEALAALANSDGGTLTLTLSPLSDVNEILDRVLQAALTIQPPLIVPLPRRIGEQVIADVPAGMPHVYATSTGRYLRHETSGITALPPHDLHRLMMMRGELTFESEAAAKATRDDLDWDRIAAYVERLPGVDATRAEEVMLRRGCLIRTGSTLQPTHAGILLFGKDPQRFVRGALVTAVRFAGDIMGDRHNRQDIGGTLVDQIQRAETFLHDHLRRNVQMGTAMAREEQFEYPLEAARELLINAVAHRDYSIEGDNIRLLIFSNRMEVHSPGKLPGYMTLLNLRDERFSRNPIIVQVLSDMLYIERLGYGVDRVLELMQSQHLRTPEFAERDGSFGVTLFSAPVAPVQPDTLQGVFRGHEINPRQERALTMLRDKDTDRLTNSDLQTLFPDVHSETIRRDLVDLVNKALLVKMGQKRGSYYVLRPEPRTEPANEE